MRKDNCDKTKFDRRVKLSKWSFFNVMKEYVLKIINVRRIIICNCFSTNCEEQIYYYC